MIEVPQPRPPEGDRPWNPVPLPFKRSTHCANGACVEVAGTRVRDGKDRHGAVLEFSPAAWTAFLGSIR